MNLPSGGADPALAGGVARDVPWPAPVEVPPPRVLNGPSEAPPMDMEKRRFCLGERGRPRGPVAGGATAGGGALVKLVLLCLPPRRPPLPATGAAAFAEEAPFPLGVACLATPDVAVPAA